MIEDPSTLPKRKHYRLKEFDYSQPGSYFVTLCTKNRSQLFGTLGVGLENNYVVGRGDLTPPKIQLSSIGKIVENFIESISKNYENVSIDKYVIMPNHIHLLLTLTTISTVSGDSAASMPSLHRIIRAFKSLVTRSVGQTIWQVSYYDHIIRNDSDYQKVWDYIDVNPDKWQEDKHFT